MTSRRPYWCPKTKKRRPCWCPKPILWELNSFLMQTLSFVSINLHRRRPREWKHSIRELKQRRRRRQRKQQQKKIRIDWQNNNIERASRFHCTFRSRRCTTAAWKWLVSRFVQDGNTRPLLSFSFLDKAFIESFRIQLQKKIANMRRIKRDGTSVIKFKPAQILFLSDIFVALAVVVA